MSRPEWWTDAVLPGIIAILIWEVGRRALIALAAPFSATLKRRHEAARKEREKRVEKMLSSQFAFQMHYLEALRLLSTTILYLVLVGVASIMLSIRENVGLYGAVVLVLYSVALLLGGYRIITTWEEYRELGRTMEEYARRVAEMDKDDRQD